METINSLYTVIEGDNNDMITFLRKRIEDVKEGNITALAFIGLVPEGGCGSWWSEEFEEFEEDVFRSMGAMENLKLNFWDNYRNGQ